MEEFAVLKGNDTVRRLTHELSLHGGNLQPTDDSGSKLVEK